MAGPGASPNASAPPDADWAEDPPPAELPDPRSRAGRPRPSPEDPSEALPPWARFPHVDPSRHGRAFEEVDVPRSPESRSEENERVLREIDGLHQEIRSKSRPGAPLPPPTAPPVEDAAPPPRVPASAPPKPAAPSPRDIWESPPSYLEERLRLADLAATELGRDVRAIDASWGRVRDRVARLESEVRAAHGELEFIHSAARGWTSLTEPRRAGLSSPMAPRAAAASVPSATAARARPTPAIVGTLPATAAYAAFTADRYNRTIGDLKARRRRLAGWTFLTAGAISLVLVAATLLAHPSMPPLWLAVLPAVWMIPVPFFVLSFRGTQRVLRHNHLEVPGGPP